MRDVYMVDDALSDFGAFSILEATPTAERQIGVDTSTLRSPIERD